MNAAAKLDEPIPAIPYALTARAIVELVQRNALEYAQRMGPIRRAVRVALEAGQLGEEQGGSALETIERLDALAINFHELVQMGKVKLPEAP